MSFPRQFTFNGIDYFLYQLDKIMSRSSGNRNICTFVLEFDNRLQPDQVQQFLTEKSAYRWLTSLRLHKGLPFTRLQWRSDPSSQFPEIIEHQLDNADQLAAVFSRQTLDLENESPFRIAMVQIKEQSTWLVFYWHHALMDAHGAERFIHYLGTPTRPEEPEWFEANAHCPPEQPLHQRALLAREMKEILYETSKLPLLTLFNQQRQDQKTCYRLLTFTEQDAQCITQRARASGAGFMTSLFYLAATARAVAAIQEHRSSGTGDILVPVPQDRRKRGTGGAIIGNQTTLFFYRLPQSSLTDLKQSTRELINQMQMLMRSGFPDKYLVMMDLLQHIPGLLYRYLLRSPTGGLMGSFFYSDTGDSLQDYGRLFDHVVLDAVHYPPNTCPPGLTFIYTRFRGRLQITIGFMSSVINDNELDRLVGHLREDLLGEGADDATRSGT